MNESRHKGERCGKHAAGQMELRDGAWIWLCSPHMGVYLRRNLIRW